MKAKKLKKDLPLFFQMLWSSQNIQTLFVKYLKLFNFFPDHRATPLRTPKISGLKSLILKPPFLS